MARIVSVIEVLAQSDQSWEQAAQNAVSEAAKTVRHIRSIYGQEFQADVQDGKITAYRLNAKISFDLEESDARG
ncbi:MAG: dodecin domain-containing protein [Verrucomicrobia bacterium]|nr:dodecin domain-containing protein [Verrucomicrobiota bacterium]